MMDIYVGSIPFKWKEKDLVELFSSFGQVSSVKIVIDKITRQNKGFGFVSMPVDNEAFTAIESLNGQEFFGRIIQVSVSVPVRRSSKPGVAVKNILSGDQKHKTKGKFFRKK